MNLCRFLGATTSNKDYLCYLIYMFAYYIFNDVTLVNGRVDIYNEDSQIMLMIRVNGDIPDSVEFIRRNAKGATKRLRL